MIIEASKSQDKQLASSKPRGPCVVSVLVLRPEYQESWLYKFQSKFQHAQDPRGASVSVQIQRPEKTNVLAQGGVPFNSAFFIQIFSWWDEAHTH